MNIELIKRYLDIWYFKKLWFCYCGPFEEDNKSQQRWTKFWCGCHFVQCRQGLQYRSIMLHRTAQYWPLPGFQFWINSNHTPIPCCKNTKKLKPEPKPLVHSSFFFKNTWPVFIFINIPPLEVYQYQSIFARGGQKAHWLNQMSKHIFLACKLNQDKSRDEEIAGYKIHFFHHLPVRIATERRGPRMMRPVAGAGVWVATPESGSRSQRPI